jgi:hypothetical protein
MSGEPLDLRTLAEVDEPDVVKVALKTFRRRILTRYVWITLVIGLVLAAVFWGLQPTTLEQRVQSATPVDEPQYVWRVVGLGVGWFTLAKLGDDVGMQFVVVPNAKGQAAGEFQAAGGRETPRSRSAPAECSTSASARTHRRSIAGATPARSPSSRGAPRASFVVSMSDLGVYPGIWKEEG